MLARQRSGTNALRELLGRHPDIFCMPEVFHAEPSPYAHLEVETNFFRFLDGHRDGTIWRSTSFDVQERIFLDFLDHLRSLADKRYVLIDVKFNSTHHLDGPWRAVSAPPTLFRFMADHRTRTLTITRRNYLRWYVSWQKADATQAWTTLGDSRDDVGVEISVRDLLWNLAACRREDEMVEDALGSDHLARTWDYTELFPDRGGSVSPEVLGSIAEWLEVESAFPQTEPEYRKQSVRGLRETIANYDEVAAALTGTEFEYCLEDEPMYRDRSAA